MFPIIVTSFLKKNYVYFAQFEENEIVKIEDDPKTWDSKKLPSHEDIQNM